MIKVPQLKLYQKKKEQAKREILDAESDLITAQQEGQDASELQKRLNELKTEAATLDVRTRK